MTRKKPSADPMARVSEICLALPGATSEVMGVHNEHAAYRVGKRTFTYFLNNNHGDGKVAVTCKVLPGDNKVLSEANPERFYLPAYMAHQGWVALRLDVGEVDWEEVSELVKGSHQLITRKKR